MDSPVSSREQYENISKTDLFIDKTLFIKEIFQSDSKHLLITAPTGFGKTTNLHTLVKFLGIPMEQTNTYKLFSKSKIMESAEFIQEHFLKHPVVEFHLTTETFFKTLSVTYYWYYEKYLSTSKILSAHDKTQLTSYKNCCSINLLFEMISKHFDKKIIVVVDNYDNMFEGNSWENLENTLKDIGGFIQIIAESKFVERSIIFGHSVFGTVYFPKTVKIYRFLDDHPFVQYFGLTIPEVTNIFETYCNNTELIDVIIENFSGFQTSRGDIKLLHPSHALYWISKFLYSKPELDQVEICLRFNETNHLNYLVNYIGNPEIRYILEKIVQKYLLNIVIPTEIKMEHIFGIKESFFFFYLMEKGLLSPSNQKDSFKIPNRTVCIMIKTIIADYYYYSYNLTIEDMKKTVSIMDKFDRTAEFPKIIEIFFKSFKRLLSTFHYSNCDENDDIKECTVRDILFGLLCQTEYLFNITTFLDEAPIMLIVVKSFSGLIIELGSTSIKALETIINRTETMELKCENYVVKNVILIGLCVNSVKDVSMSYLECEIGKEDINLAVTL